jgi:hypothetical protein
MSRQPKTVRWYQRGWSNATTNVSRYSASGSTHKNGMGAKSWVIALVVASSSADAQAGSASQKSTCVAVTAACGLAVSIASEVFAANPATA